jgi:hypothetical protein
MKPDFYGLKIQLITLTKNVNVVNYIMTQYDINYCKVALDGDGNVYQFQIDGTQQISENTWNIFRLFKDNIKHITDTFAFSKDNSTYYLTLLRSMNGYLSKVSGRIAKYKDRGVKFGNDEMIKFDAELNEIKKVIERIVIEHPLINKHDIDIYDTSKD